MIRFALSPRTLKWSLPFVALSLLGFAIGVETGIFPLRSKAKSAPPGTIAVQRRLMPFDAAKICLADAQQFAPEDAIFFRYIFFPEDADDYTQAVNWVANSVLSHSTFIQYGYQIHPNILRFDLRLLAPQVDDLQNLIDTYEELAFDPYFHEFIEILDEVDQTRDDAINALKAFLAVFDDKAETKYWKTKLKVAQLQRELSNTRVFDINFLNNFVKEAELELARPYAHPAVRGPPRNDEYVAALGKKFKAALEALRDAVKKLAEVAGKADAKVEVRTRRSGQGAIGVNQEIPIPARHAGEAFELLVELAQSDAVIVRADYFFMRALASVDLGHGAGLYYQFLGIKTNQNDGLTDFERLLAGLGVDLEVVAKQRTQASAALFFSKVTGRTRKVVAIPSASIAPARGTGVVVYTQDPSDEQSAAANEPIRNLIAFTFAAQELIYERPNGMLGFVLFNAAGVLQNSAPDNVVKDHTIPAPYTARLYSGMSCIRCHGPQGGHMFVTNDIKRLTQSGADILDDLASADGLEDLIDQLVGEYEGDFERPLQRSRDDYGDATFRATAGVRYGDQVRTFPGWRMDKLSAVLSKVHLEYTYKLVTPAVALGELGYKVEDEIEARELLMQVMPAYPPDGFGLTLLDPTIAALRAGINITRPAWENVYFDAALRSILTAKVIAEGEVQAAQGKAPSPSALLPGNNQHQEIWQRLQARRTDRLKVKQYGVHPSSARPRSKQKPPVMLPQPRRDQLGKVKIGNRAIPVPKEQTAP